MNGSMRNSALMKLLVMLMACMITGTASARSPDEPLVLINPYPATGAVDITGTVVMSRALRAMQNQVTPSTTDALVQHLRQSLVDGLGAYVEVRRNPRGGGEAAALAVVETDRRALLFAGSGLAAGAALDVLRVLQPVALVAQVPAVLVSHGGSGAVDVTRLMAQAQRREQPLQIGIAGERTAGRELLQQIQQYWPRGISAVSYNGGNGALRGVLARQVPAALVPLPAALPYTGSGRIRFLAIAAEKRHAALPTVPTFVETGWIDVTTSGWHGLFAAPTVPADEMAKWQQAMSGTLNGNVWRDAVISLGYSPDYRGPAALRMALATEVRRSAGDSSAAGRIAAMAIRTLPAVSPP